jgi:hypothetical protein
MMGRLNYGEGCKAVGLVHPWLLVAGWVIAGGANQVCQGQNLVPNPSFEDYINCPHDYGSSYELDRWFMAYPNADLYNACDGNDTCGVPTNVAGYQEAATGDGYVGMLCYGGDSPDGFRELIGVRLEADLIPGTTYFASFKVSWTSGYPSLDLYTRYASNKLGIRLSTDSLFGDEWQPSPNWAHVYSDSIVTDSVGWTTLSGQFVADSSFRYLYLGNFFDNAHVQTIVVDPTCPDEYSYYYFDDVCLSTAPNNCPMATSTVEHIWYPEPSARYDPTAQGIVVLDLRPGTRYQAELFDIAGRILWQSVALAHSNELRYAVPLHLASNLVVLRLWDGREEHRFKLLTPNN